MDSLINSKEKTVIERQNLLSNEVEEIPSSENVDINPSYKLSTLPRFV
jgi:hypothetical protein